METMYYKTTFKETMSGKPQERSDHEFPWLLVLNERLP